MPAAARNWLFILLTVGYLVAAHVALIYRSAPVAGLAVAILVVLLLASIKGRYRDLLRLFIAVAGAVIVFLVLRGAPPLPLMLPPVLIPAAIAWTFGRTLLPGRTALIERVARAFHAPVVPAPELLAYARSVTWAWTWLLVLITGVNAFLILGLSPGGLIESAGFLPLWPVAPSVFVWFGNTGTYLLIAAMFAAEFSIRLWRFPDYRIRNPLQFIREARARMPSIVAAVKHG